MASSEKWWSTPPEEIIWLTPNDLRSMGATLTGKPAQVPSDAQALAPPNAKPNQLPPSSGNPAAKNRSPTWDDITATALRLSSDQNNGRPRTARSCQPELKLCNTAILFQGKDVPRSVSGSICSGWCEVMLRVSEDINGKIIDRQICTFNSFKDVRTCVDWDTGAGHRDMKDDNGNWQKVADE
jgi:hypothetical protein